jgi:hypothetical protein
MYNDQASIDIETSVLAPGATYAAALIALIGFLL